MPLALATVFAGLPDPRIETANKLHKSTDILVIATGAVIAGADGAAKAEQDDFVIYYNEWRYSENGEGEAVLGPFGGEHLTRIVGHLPFVPFPVIIQPAPGDPVLTERRRQAVIDALQDAGIPDATRRVVTARPWAEGLGGDEALAVTVGRLNVNPGYGFTGTFTGFGGVSGFAGGFTGFGFGPGFGFGAGFGGVGTGSGQ